MPTIILSPHARPSDSTFEVDQRDFYFVSDSPVICAHCANETDMVYSVSSSDSPPFVCVPCFERGMNNLAIINPSAPPEITSIHRGYTPVIQIMDETASDSGPFTPAEIEEDGGERYGRRAESYVEHTDFEGDLIPLEEVDMQANGVLLLPDIPGRRTHRMISVEQEIGAGREIIPSTFYAQGLSAQNNMSGYHSSPSGHGPLLQNFIHVENDASVNAEIIYCRMRLDMSTVADQFERGVRIVRAGIAAGQVRLDARCGLHIHVDMRGMGVQHVANLYNLWNFLEDTIFRMSAACWPKHRTELNGGSYSHVTPKGMTSNRAITEAMRQSGRGAMSLGGYLSQITRCRCGAILQYGSWEDCTCEMNKPTVEFRVFNTTANLRKMNAYTALSLALVEHARHTEISAGNFPSMPWLGTRHLHEFPDAEHIRRCSYILQEMPFTEQEKANLAYCMKASSLSGLSGVNFNDLIS